MMPNNYTGGLKKKNMQSLLIRCVLFYNKKAAVLLDTVAFFKIFCNLVLNVAL
jgi:hypothetical protein